MNTINNNSQKIIAAVLSATFLVAAPFAAFAQSDKDKDRQKNKNDMRNLGAGLGGAALYSLLKGRGTEALILGGGAAYAGKKMEDARKAQEKEKREQDDRDRREKSNYKYRRDNTNYSPGGRGNAMSAMTSTPSRQPVDVLVNSQKVSFAGDSGAEVIGGHTYVPLRGVLEKLGASVNYDDSSRSITATKGSKTVKLPADGDATVNGKSINLDAPAFVMNGRTMVPLRFMAETFDAQVNYNEADRAVHIDSVGSV
jgi:hypothetical protein